MAEIKRFGAAKRFGARYGRKLKQKFAEVEAQARQKYDCPYCSFKKVKRVAAGIWQCRKCNAKFTSRAYTISKKVVVQAVGEFGGAQSVAEEEQRPRKKSKPQKWDISGSEESDDSHGKQKAPQEEESEEQEE